SGRGLVLNEEDIDYHRPERLVALLEGIVDVDADNRDPQRQAGHLRKFPLDAGRRENRRFMAAPKPKIAQRRGNARYPLRVLTPTDGYPSVALVQRIKRDSVRCIPCSTCEKIGDNPVCRRRQLSKRFRDHGTTGS